MTGTVERVDPNDDAGEDDAMLQEGMVSKEGMESLRLSETLTPNSYSLIYIGDPKTSAFWYGITFFVFQTTLPLLALSDLVDFTTTLNPFRAPPDVTLAVRTAGFLTLLLAVIFFRDLLDAFERLHEGYDRESALAQCPHATFCKWLLAYTLQLINGLIFLVLIFILNVQSTTVVGMLLNFAALGFITEIDDFAFELALRGYFSDSLQQTCEHVTKHKTPDMKGPLLRKIALFFFSCAVWGPYFYVVARSQRGDYVCTRIEAQFGDSFYPELQQSSGAYFVDFTYRENDRLLYQDEATGIFSIFRYCFSEKAWVFGILSDREVEDYDDLYDEICERGYWISKGPESPGSFNILDKSPMDWKTTKADDPNDFLAYPVDYFSLTCLECNKNTCNEFGGECGLQEIQGFLYNVCLCYEGYFGERCEYTEEDICDELGYDSRFESFEPLKPDFPESFKLVQNSTAGEFFNYYNKAVYSYEDATTNKFYLIAYFGRRYYMLNGDLDSLKASIGFDDDDVDLDAYFMYIEFLNSGLVGFAGFDYEGSGINPIYVSEPIDLHTANDKPTPAEIGWFYTDDRLTPGPPVSTRLVCI